MKMLSAQLLTVLGLAGIVTAIPQMVVPLSDQDHRTTPRPSPTIAPRPSVIGDCTTVSICRDFVNSCGMKYGGCHNICRPWPTYSPPRCPFPTSLNPSTPHNG
ncbi:uncharacterized protein LY79DRAFT_543568 [Colletotrichum navitas]|uniref:Uncharacterized protein n=1 Tax=Colletotrichum navitas TaxID=681940 RepID=A0AAD8Q6K2_9PEZI|nr:uncharacterized protein LY79DRAFT_543568 [Colletotrichum navitas]KAK1596559.1 hypothetical protein LY79DRAFT_543568 [Colletotrichum navitas]